VKALPCCAEAARSAMIMILRMLDMEYVFFLFQYIVYVIENGMDRLVSIQCNVI